MWIVRVALERPYTFIVLAIMLLILGPLTILRTPVDIFPTIDIPVVGVVWSFTGLPADEMATRMTGQFERVLTTTVNDIEHSESQSLNGVSVIKIFFQPGVKIDMAVAQVTAIAQTALRQLPPGSLPPLILSYSAATVPVIQIGLTSATLDEQQLFDQATNFMRPILSTVAGAASPYPYGGKQPQVQVDLDQTAMRGLGITPSDVENAINSQNLILPAGTEKIGEYEYNIRLNASPNQIDTLNDLPITVVNGRTIYIRDVAHVRNGSGPQTNMVRLDGQRGILVTIQKTGTVSTLDVINGVKERLNYVKATLPPAISFRAIGDQSVFVDAAVNGVIYEGVTAAALTGLLILLFLGNLRSTLIITISIPLSILAAIITLSALGQTINIMTLGGLALAVGILVDDATVAIESINHHLEEGKHVRDAILAGAAQIALPALVSTLAICIVFVPMFLLSGVARFLFVPLAEAVVFAMLASYILSRTLVPTLAMYWLKDHEAAEQRPRSSGPFTRFQRGFERSFVRMREAYGRQLETQLRHPLRLVGGVALVVLLSLVILPFLGEDFFPTVDGGQIRLQVRGPAGTRVEQTAATAELVEKTIRDVLPAGEIDTVVANIGVPISGINMTYSNSGVAGAEDAEILITLKPDHTPVAELTDHLRAALPVKFPGIGFAFLPADMVGQILNYGLPAPIDIQLSGPDPAALRKGAVWLYNRLRATPGITDFRIQQPADAPEFDVDVDRSRAIEQGLQQRDVAGNLLISLSGSQQTAPNFWLDHKSGVTYPVVTQTPQRELASLDDLRNVPVSGGIAGHNLDEFSAIRRGSSASLVSHYNVQQVIDLYAGVRGTDMGSVARAIDRAMSELRPNLPRGVLLSVRGQIQTMNSSFNGLGGGVLFSIVLVYLLLVVNFQSWLDPLIIISALPAALAGIIWMLFMTHTTISVPALTGALMTVGVATANSILVVSFAREQVNDHDADPLKASLEAGIGRLRPVLMTASAMIIGMVPMSLGLGDGGEQNAPLGRAVIGGLLFATPATLFLVPAMFRLVHGRARHRPTTSDGLAQ